MSSYEILCFKSGFKERQLQRSKEVFNEDEVNYDKYQPEYPNKLFENYPILKLNQEAT